MPAALEAACCLRRSFFSLLLSGRYLDSSLKSSVAWFLSRVRLNWLMLGGTFRRWYRIWWGWNE